MGTTFIVMSALKLAAVGATGIVLSSAFAFFHNFEWKPKRKDKKEKGESDGNTNAAQVGKVLRQKAGSAD